ncbi:prepilin-type N-terminal cleavage/methylation domain-containing protein [Candidatus Saccharibacteria bacterium]|nr:prepilin-type N-terminal cleavage/methylation domain-containing protein [Candidatus Saccharibacteria bacterium]
MKDFIERLSKKTLKTKSGFTLIEFSIALAVLAIFLILILQVSNNTIAIYQKGLATKSISTAGRDLLDELSRSIAASPTGGLKVLCDKTKNPDDCKNDSDIQLGIVYQIVYNGQNPAYGMFCTGKYSYFWNSGYVLQSGGQGQQVTYKNGASNRHDALVRFEDPGNDLCINYMEGRGLNVPTNKAPVVLLQNDSDLQTALYDFTIFQPSQDVTISRIFYSGTFVLGTLSGNISNITASNDYCRDEAMRSLSSDLAYCSINKFNFAAQALGGQND